MKKLLTACICATLLSVGFCNLTALADYDKGDFDKNGIIDDGDLAVFRQTLLNDATDTQYDFNHSGTVDVLDLVRLKCMTAIGYDDEGQWSEEW